MHTTYEDGYYNYYIKVWLVTHCLMVRVGSTFSVDGGKSRRWAAAAALFGRLLLKC